MFCFVVFRGIKIFQGGKGEEGGEGGGGQAVGGRDKAVRGGAALL